MRFAKQRAAALILLLLIVPYGSSQQSADRRTLVYKKKYIMGTVFEIAAYGNSSERTSSAIDAAFQEIVRMDDLMSNYKPESPLSHLNRSAHFHAEKVPPDLYRAIERGVQLSRLSNGKFDITVAPLVNLWKAALAGDRTPSPAQQQEAEACVGYDKIELTPPDQILLRSSCLQLDLGAIGKGYAVDRASDKLLSLGIQNAFLNAGGSTIVAMGAPPGEAGWIVHLRDPSHKVDPYVVLKNGSVSTSEQTAASLLGQDSPGHIIDPSTGHPVKSGLAVSVIAASGTLSDGFSTTLLLLGPQQGKVLVSRTPDVSAIWLSPKAEVETATNGPHILFGGKL
ncbi:MAG TPA: FAD:protein FMN transferase [Candidatus Sulfotelmatobacter sp.]|nr:FAD:protein FMN transferase [Candidatus Sulfotelmatobacter sp.]